MVGFIVMIAAGVLWACGLSADKCMIVFYVGAGLTALHLICDSFDVWASRNPEKGG
jgi:hypothetical protein